MTDTAEVARVHRQLGEMLARSEAYAAMPERERGAFVENLAKVGGFLGGERWLEQAGKTGPAATPMSRAQAAAKPPPDAVDQTKLRLAEKPGQVNSDFKAAAMREGVQGFQSLVQAVDFPEFVSGLVKGVFNAVVDASIQQMQAYGELLTAVAKGVDEFAQENITDVAARQHLADQHPRDLQLDFGDDGSNRLKMRGEDADGEGLASQYGLDSVDLEDQESETALVNAAKLQMAQQRQQLMAAMVMMGINRIVITNGRINAKVVFDIATSDQADRHAKASMADQMERDSGGFATVAAPWGASGGYSHENHKTTVRSSVADDSESKAEMKAKLSGEVLLAFKSETLPPEKMLDQGGLALLGDKSRPLPLRAPRSAPPPAQPAQPAPAPAAPAPAPAPAAAAPVPGR